MIELRWVTRQRVADDLCSIKERVLQYREGWWGWGEDFNAPEPTIWVGSEWRDVPEVSDD